MPDHFIHAYVAYKVWNNPWYIAGNIFADIEGLVNLSRNKVDMTHKQTLRFAKYLEKRRFNKAFILGLLHHRKLDQYAHKKYVIPLSKRISKELGLSEHYLHTHTEFMLSRKVLKESPRAFKKMWNSIIMLDNKKFIENVKQFFKTAKNIMEMFYDSLKIIKLNRYNRKGLIKTYKIVKKYLPAGIRFSAIKYYLKFKKVDKYLEKEEAKIYKEEIEDYIRFQKKLLESKR